MMKLLNRFKPSILFSLGLFMSSCRVGPEYTPPSQELPEEWHGPESSDNSSSSPQSNSELFTNDIPDTSWWEVFEDHLLNQYICLAAEHNKDIQIAVTNILQARAARQLAASYFYPQVSNDINALRAGLSKNGLFSNIGGNIPSPLAASAPKLPRYQSLFNLLFDATWEIDLFGKTARSVEAADARILSSIEILNDTLLSVFAEVARNYVEVRTAQQRTLLIHRNIELLQQNANITEKRFQAGLANSLDVERILAEENQIRSTLPKTIADMYSGIYNLSVLTGYLPEALLEQMLPVQPLPQMPQNIAIGIRSDVLRRRPDVRNAEYELAAATADVGVSVASFYPSFKLGGAGGLQSLSLDNLFKSGSFLWIYGANIDTPIFTGWSLEANLDSSRAKAKQAALEYEKTVLTAIREAETGIVTVMQDDAAIKASEETVERYQKIVRLTNNRYSQGAINVIDLLDTERQLITAQDNLLTYRSNILIDLIALYKALGGGWIASDSEEQSKDLCL